MPACMGPLVCCCCRSLCPEPQALNYAHVGLIYKMQLAGC